MRFDSVGGGVDVVATLGDRSDAGEGIGTLPRTIAHQGGEPQFDHVIVAVPDPEPVRRLLGEPALRAAIRVGERLMMLSSEVAGGVASP